MHIHPFATVLRKAILTVRSFRTKWIKHDIVSVDLIWESTGHMNHEGQPIPGTRSGLLNIIAKKEEDGTLKIVLGHNVDYTAVYKK